MKGGAADKLYIPFSYIIPKSSAVNSVLLFLHYLKHMMTLFLQSAQAHTYENYLTSARGRTFLENLIFAQLLKKFPTSYGT